MSRATVRGSSYVRVQVKGGDAIHRVFRSLLEPEMTNQIDKANKRAANVFKKAVAAEARPVSKRMARATRVKRAKTGKPGWIVGGRRRTAFFWPFVIGGTRDHGPRKAKALAFESGGRLIVTKRVRGVKPNDLVERAARKSEPAAFREAEQTFVKGTGL